MDRQIHTYMQIYIYICIYIYIYIYTHTHTHKWGAFAYEAAPRDKLPELLRFFLHKNAIQINSSQKRRSNVGSLVIIAIT